MGCGSALPTRSNLPSSQLLELRNKQFLIDCGEGMQIRMRQMPVRVSRMNHIFISHLHGDHCFGLIGLICTLGMLGRTADLYIHAQPDLERLLQPLINYHGDGMLYKVHFEPFNPKEHAVIYEDRSVCVSTLPLRHRVPCAGFLFEEKPRLPHILPEQISRYNIPHSSINLIKQGAGFTTEDGTYIPHEQLTTPATSPLRYAYCSDTAYNERIIPLIQGVDCLYHEATFGSEMSERARHTMHSTAAQAATIAQKAQVGQLIIGHFSARHADQGRLFEEARSIFPNTILAHDGMRHEIRHAITS